MRYDVIVIGGGPSGMFAAIGAKKKGAHVLLIEKNNNLGKKMLISGGGRCNVTNISSIEEIIENIPGNGKFLYSGMHQFSNKDVFHFFEDELGIPLKIEEKGKVFPQSDRSKTLINALATYLHKIDVEIMYQRNVKDILLQDKAIRGVILDDEEIISTESVVIATGGISYPKTGSTGDGFSLLTKVGHTLSEFFPSSVPIISNDPIIKDKVLQGIALREVRISLYNGKKYVKSEIGDLLFTHFGLSGPAVLRLSRYVSIALKEGIIDPLKAVIDIMPSEREEELLQKINRLIKQAPHKIALNGLNGLIPDKLLHYILIKENIDQKRMKDLSSSDLMKLVDGIKRFSISIDGTRDIKEAFVTGGGVQIKEIYPKTFASKIINGLYVAGEVLDVDAYTGGYNMQAAFTTGFIAGRSAAGFCQLK